MHFCHYMHDKTAGLLNVLYVTTEAFAGNDLILRSNVKAFFMDFFVRTKIVSIKNYVIEPIEPIANSKYLNFRSQFLVGNRVQDVGLHAVFIK